jgi:hypothetical protein
MLAGVTHTVCHRRSSANTRWWWSKLVLLIDGGRAICENARHFHNMNHPFAHSKLALKSHFLFLVELMECIDAGRTKRSNSTC